MNQLPVLAESILNFWFGELDEHGMASSEKRQQWFKSDKTFDERIVRLYADHLEPARMGGLDLWTEDLVSLTALTVLLDQFPRNAYRGSEKSFIYDSKALATVLEAVHCGHYMRAPASYAYFLLMPTMHSENLEVQELGIDAFGKLAEAVPEPAREMIESARKYAKAHRDVIARFGRFPSRNAAMGRPSTPEELSYLAEGGVW